MKERLERLKECAIAWVEARAKFFDNTKNTVKKMALKNAERELVAATREVQRIEDGHGDSSGAGNKSKRPPRWISMAEATPEMELGIERDSTSIPTEYRTQSVLVWDDTFEEVRTDYRIETAHGTLWKSRRPHRWWMPRRSVEQINTARPVAPHRSGENENENENENDGATSHTAQEQ